MKTSKIHINSRKENGDYCIKSRDQKGKKMFTSHSTHKLDLERVKGLATVKSFKKAPKIATKREIYTKTCRRDKINLVRFINYFELQKFH